MALVWRIQEKTEGAWSATADFRLATEVMA